MSTVDPAHGQEQARDTPDIPGGVEAPDADTSTEEAPTSGTPEPSDAKKQRAENASLRRRLRELEAAEDERRKADLSDTQRLQEERDRLLAERTDLAARMAERDLRDTARRLATEQGFATPDDAWRYLDLTPGDDADDALISETLADVAKTRPYLLASPQAARPAAPRTGGTGNPSGGVRSERDYSTITPDEYAALPPAEAVEARRQLGSRH